MTTPHFRLRFAQSVQPARASCVRTRQPVHLTAVGARHLGLARDPSFQRCACDTIFTFDAKTPTGGTLVNPKQLKNELMFVVKASFNANTYLCQ